MRPHAPAFAIVLWTGAALAYAQTGEAPVGAQPALAADEDDPETLRGHARERRDARACEDARALLLRALERSGAEPAVQASVLLDLAEVELDLWQTASAAERLAEAAALDAIAPPSADARIRSREVAARLLRVRGDYANALVSWQAALAERRRQVPLDPRSLSDALAATAEALWFTGDPERAEELFDEAKTLTESMAPPDGAVLGRRLNDLALMAQGRGDLDRAETLLQRALELVRGARGDSHPALAPRWISLANLAVVREDLLTADAAYEQAAALLAKFEDRSLASEKATLALNRGSLDARLGRVDSAREQLERARDLWTETRGADHPHLAWVSESLADILADAGRVGEAAVALQDARTRRERTAPGSPQAVLTTARLAVLRAREGRAQEARALLRRVEAAARRLGVGAGPYFAASLAGRRAEAYEALGDFATAARLRTAVEAGLARSLPAGHPVVADARGQRARLAWRQGQPRLALRWASEAWETQRRVIAATAHALPEGDALRYLERSRDLRDLLLCAAAGAPPRGRSPLARDQLLRTIAASRALVADGPVATTDSEGLRKAERAYAALLWQPVWNASADYADELGRARRHLEETERREARRSPPPEAAASADPWTTLDPNDALVSFGRYRCPATRGASPDAGYLAFVRTGAGAARTVRFPDGAALERAIDDWYEATTAAVHAPPTEAQDEEVDARGRVLTKALWAPLAAAVGPAERVFIVPDGKLHSVSWYALPTTPGSYLIDEPRVLHVLTAESDLALPAAADEPSRARSVVVMADPQLESAAQTADASALRAACQFVDPQRLPRLGEARAEARQLEALARAAGRPVLLATGAEASEGWLRAHAPRAGILHLAAHGGVLSPESCREPAATAAEPAAARVRSLWAEAVRARPLMRSGLLLTGAARFTPLDAPGSDDDGVLVAEEAARLDLRGAQWVVLSACSTRRGPVVDAEGALGLHRAFHRAGARTVIASLWDVQDAPARRFMDALYGARLRGGRSTADAMRDAERAVLAQLRKDGRSTHPVQWAAFVASGDWR
jgi:CHAT domain-containing protein/tetratricopeptide (TPR) repeat protein